MKFMFLVQLTDEPANTTPTPELMEAMDKYIQESFKSGILLDTGGLASYADAVRVQVADSKLTVVDGPFAEAKEIVGGYAIMQLRSREEALEHAKKFMELHQKHAPGWSGTCEVRQIFGPES